MVHSSRAAGPRGVPDVDITIALLNIERFRKLLANDLDEMQRQMIICLLAEEEKKLDLLYAAQDVRQFN
jgi:hypothetical protein